MNMIQSQEEVVLVHTIHFEIGLHAPLCKDFTASENGAVQ
jgi:hypothetical protein